jgi:hypothetical protein
MSSKKTKAAKRNYHQIKRLASERFLEQGHLEATMFIARGSRMYEIEFPMPPDSSARDALAALAAIMRQMAKGADYVAVALECWFGEGQSDLRPSERPDRKEILWVILETASGQQWVALNTIVRVGDTVDLQGWEDVSDGQVTGRFANLYGHDDE